GGLLLNRLRSRLGRFFGELHLPVNKRVLQVPVLLTWSRILGAVVVHLFGGNEIGTYRYVPLVLGTSLAGYVAQSLLRGAPLLRIGTIRQGDTGQSVFGPRSHQSKAHPVRGVVPDQLGLLALGRHLEGADHVDTRRAGSGPDSRHVLHAEVTGSLGPQHLEEDWALLDDDHQVPQGGLWLPFGVPLGFQDVGPLPNELPDILDHREGILFGVGQPVERLLHDSKSLPTLGDVDPPQLGTTGPGLPGDQLGHEVPGEADRLATPR